MKLFSKCEALIEIIYNPILTMLGLDAQENGIKRIIGIEMLVAQTKAAQLNEEMATILENYGFFS